MRHPFYGLPLLVITVTGISVAGPIYSITNLGVLNGDTYSAATGINNSGQIVGVSSTSPDLGGNHGFLFQNGSLQALGALGFLDTYATDINDSGVVVGEGRSAPGSLAALMWNGGAAVDISNVTGVRGSLITADQINSTGQVIGIFQYTDALGRFLSQGSVVWQGGQIIPVSPGHATGINDLGQVVGYGNGPSSFIWQNGVFTMIGGEGAFTINNAGEVVGFATNLAPTIMEYIWTPNDGYRVVGTGPGTLGTEVRGMNNNGDFVGASSITPLLLHAELYSGGQFYDLNNLVVDNPGITLIQANAINDHGQIVGIGEIDGQQRAVLLSPVPLPEPSSLMLVAAGFLLLFTLGGKYSYRRIMRGRFHV